MWFRQAGEVYEEEWRERFCSGYWYWSSICANILAFNRREELPDVREDLIRVLLQAEETRSTEEKLLAFVRKTFAPFSGRGRLFGRPRRREQKGELTFLMRYLKESDSPCLFLTERISNGEESMAVAKLDEYLEAYPGSCRNGPDGDFPEEEAEEKERMAAYGRYLLLLMAMVRARKTDLIAAGLRPGGDFMRMIGNTMSEYRSIDEVSERTYEIYRLHFAEETGEELGANAYKLLLAKRLLDGEDHIYQVYEDAVRDVCAGAWEEAESAGEYRDLVIERMAENFAAYDFAHPLSFRFYARAIGRPLAKVVSFREQFLLWEQEPDWEKRLREKVQNARLEAEKARYVRGDFTREHLYLQGDMTFRHIHSGTEFERYLKHIFTRLGYESDLTKASGDQGADLILRKNGLVFVVQAKYYEKPVSNKAVQEAVAALKFYGANRAAVVTNNRYTKSAQTLAKKNQVILLDGEALDELVRTAYSERALGHML
ncbi:MAG: restriction endonuclease [Lachnospiraceae bacterium]|nr:restriction endonuclease [Lachnospiraceae bacterium]